jgi:hypothetical protein
MNSKNIFLLVIIGLILPTVNFEIYVTVITFLFVVSKKIVFKKSFNLFLTILFSVSCFTRFAFQGYSEDLSEFFRFIFISILLASNFKENYYYDFLNAFRIVSILLFITVLFQWIFPYSDFWSNFLDIFYSKNHYEAGLNKLAPRAMGFMSNIIEAGFLFFSSLMIALSRLSSKYNYTDLFIALMSFTGLLLTQSKSLIFIGLISLIFYLFLNWKSNKKLIIFLSVLIFYFGELFVSTFSQIERVLNMGAQTSSFLFRLNLWKLVSNVNLFESNILELLFGFGRGEFTNHYGDITLDSDFFYLLNQFGLVGMLLVLVGLSLKFINNIKSKNKFYTLYFLLIILSSFTIDLITNVKVIFFILITLYILKYEDRNSLC